MSTLARRSSELAFVLSCRFLSAPLKAEAVYVGVGEIHLLHSIVGDERLFYGRDFVLELCVRGIDVRTADVETYFAVRVSKSGWTLGRALAVEFVFGIEHEFRIAETKQAPVEHNFIHGCGVHCDIEAEQISIEAY